MSTTRVRVEGGSIVYVEERRITRQKPERYKIYLPKAMNHSGVNSTAERSWYGIPRQRRITFD